MPYTIEKYLLKKVDKKLFVIQARVVKRNWFGCITSIFNETLYASHLCKHQSSSWVNFIQEPISKKKAKFTIEILNMLTFKQ